jgi:protein O-GlcNAc transferase
VGKAGVLTPEVLFQAALACHRAGKLERAIGGYRRVLAAEPSHPGALTNLASALRQSGLPEEALWCYRRALQAAPETEELWFNYANLLQARGRSGEAEQAYRRALALRPGFAAAQLNLANLLRDEGRLAEAESRYREALRCDPDLAVAYTNLGNLLRREGRLQEAIGQHRAALRLRPGDAAVHLNLANALMDAGQPEAASRRYAEADRVLRKALAEHPQDLRLVRLAATVHHQRRRFEEAVEACRRVLAAQPADAECENALAVALGELGQWEEAVEHWRTALTLNPTHASAHLNLGTVLRRLKRHEESRRHLREAVRLAPQHAMARISLALTLVDLGLAAEARPLIDEALRREPGCREVHMASAYQHVSQARIADGLCALEQARRLDPQHPATLSSLLFASLYSDDEDAQAITDRHRRLGAQLARSAGPCFRRPERRRGGPRSRLRVAYLSPDLRAHPVGYFLEPILAHHDRDAIQVHCYALLDSHDELSRRLRSLSGRWLDCGGWHDERLGRQIAEDRIDLLIDLAGHTAHNRATLLVRRPAPVQALYLGYPCTSGLEAMDYLIADPHVAPLPLEHLYTERVLRLEHSFLCYRPQPGAPEVGALPFARNGYVTYGSFNRLAKVSGTTVGLWGAVLDAVPGSRLLIKARELADPAARADLCERLSRSGIPPSRVELLPPTTPLPALLAQYGRVDIALDSFPYNGGTTTCDALWMGVPVVSLAGEHFHARMGVSILHNVGLADLVAESPSDYVRIAAALAADPARLAGLRATLRERMKAFPLGDAAGFTRRLEGAYQAMVWNRRP